MYYDISVVNMKKSSSSPITFHVFVAVNIGTLPTFKTLRILLDTQKDWEYILIIKTNNKIKIILIKRQSHRFFITSSLSFGKTIPILTNFSISIKNFCIVYYHDYYLIKNYLFLFKIFFMVLDYIFPININL